jgi:hypothetical protein
MTALPIGSEFPAETFDAGALVDFLAEFGLHPTSLRVYVWRLENLDRWCRQRGFTITNSTSRGWPPIWRSQGSNIGLPARN